MKIISITKTFFLLLFFASCAIGDKQSIDATSKLSPEEQSAFLYEISRYTGELPKNGGYQTRTDERFDEYYKKQAEQSKLKYFYEDASSGNTFFLVTQVAPSIHEKYVALGGKLKRGANHNITEYEEVFRTWKFPMNELEPKADFLFRKMMKGEDLTAYYSDKAGVEYIEFPNSQTIYDKEKRHWKSMNNPLDSLYRLREQMQTPVSK